MFHGRNKNAGHEAGIESIREHDGRRLFGSLMRTAMEPSMLKSCSRHWQCLVQCIIFLAKLRKDMRWRICMVSSRLCYTDPLNHGDYMSFEAFSSALTMADDEKAMLPGNFTLR